jgi:hypothetical protein
MSIVIAPRLRPCPPRVRGLDPAVAARVRTMRATVCGLIVSLPITSVLGIPWGGKGADTPEHRAFHQAGGVQPVLQRANRTKPGSSVRRGHRHALASRSPFDSASRSVMPRLAGPRSATLIAASSERRSAPTKPVSSRARSRRPMGSSPIGARVSRWISTVVAAFLGGRLAGSGGLATWCARPALAASRAPAGGGSVFWGDME